LDPAGQGAVSKLYRLLLRGTRLAPLRSNDRTKVGKRG
jgi:hypothetical protein